MEVVANGFQPLVVLQRACLNQRVELKQDIAVMAIAKSHGILHYKIKDANFTVCVFCFSPLVVYIFHFVNFTCNNTREVYRRLRQKSQVLTNLKSGEHKVVEVIAARLVAVKVVILMDLIVCQQVAIYIYVLENEAIMVQVVAIMVVHSILL